MSDKKIVKVFLASSIVELEDERIRLGDFFQQLNKAYRNTGITFELSKCEDFDFAVSKNGKQADIDEEIKASDLCIMLFYKKVGDVTKHEFEVALEKFRKTEKPKIATYIRYITSPDDVSEEVQAFMDVLGSLNHYYNMYNNIDTVKLGIVMNIRLLNLDYIEPEFRNGEALVNGECVADLDNVPAFSGNENLVRLQNEYKKLQNRFDELTKQLETSPDDDDIQLRRLKVSGQKNKIEKEILSEVKYILGVLDKMYVETDKGKLSQRQVEGYRLFELGKYDEALEILDLDTIRNEILYNESLVEKGIEGLQINVNELKQRIDILEAKGRAAETLEEITANFEEIVRLTETYDLDYDILINYCDFLLDQNRFHRGIELGEKALKHAKEDTAEWAKAANILASTYSSVNRYYEAEKLHIEALETRRKLADANPEAYSNDVAASCSNLAFVYFNTNRYDEAEKLCIEALEISRKLADANHEAYSAYVATSCNNLAIVYKYTNRYDEAEKLYIEALEISRKLAESNPEAYSADVASSCNNLASVYSDINRYDEAEKLHIEALEISRKLAESNPEAYSAYVALSCNNLAGVYSNTNRYDEAEKLYIEALEINRKLAESNPEAYSKNVALSCIDLANLYNYTNRYDEAEKLFLEALEIWRKLADSNPEAYSADVASSYNNLAIVYSNTNRYDEAEKLYIEALEIYRKLADSNPEAYSKNVAASCNNLAGVYINTNRYDEAEKLLIEALEMNRKLADANPEAYSNDVAIACNNLALMYSATNRYDEAEKLHIEALEIYRKLAESNPEAYSADVALSCRNLALVYIYTNRLSEAESFLDEALAIYTELSSKNPDIYSNDMYLTVGRLISIIFMRYSKLKKKYMFDKMKKLYLNHRDGLLTHWNEYPNSKELKEFCQKMFDKKN